jgi:hypothetical protein
MERLGDLGVIRAVETLLERSTSICIGRLAEQHDIVTDPSISLLQMVPPGKASKKVATSLFTVAGLLSYRGTHWVITPPGFKWRLAISKYSLE